MDNPTERLYQLALSMTPHVGPVHARLLIEAFGNAEAIFKAKYRHLLAIEGIGEIRARQIKKFDLYKDAEEELQFMDKHHIQPLFITDKAYPQRLLNCYDPPILLFFKGHADLNASRIISIVGTRKPTEYGKQITEKLIADLSSSGCTIVSGLAYGIDIIGHKSALKYQMPTVAVMAHGLDRVYPNYHTSLAKEMIAHGGLLSEFRSGTLPDRHHFPSRNRIVAGICDAVMVIETGLKGGSMITAEMANGYNKDVFAIPGRVTDPKSEGSNFLIRHNKAILITNSDDLVDVLGWVEKKSVHNEFIQQHLFMELSDDEKTVFNLLKEKTMHIDELHARSKISSCKIAAAILNLELQQLIICQPGKQYSLA